MEETDRRKGPATGTSETDDDGYIVTGRAIIITALALLVSIMVAGFSLYYAINTKRDIADLRQQFTALKSQPAQVSGSASLNWSAICANSVKNDSTETEVK